MKKLTPYGKNLLGFIVIVLLEGYVFLRDNYQDHLLNDGKTKKPIALLIEKVDEFNKK